MSVKLRGKGTCPLEGENLSSPQGLRGQGSGEGGEGGTGQEQGGRQLCLRVPQ